MLAALAMIVAACASAPVLTFSPSPTASAIPSISASATVTVSPTAPASPTDSPSPSPTVSLPPSPTLPPLPTASPTGSPPSGLVELFTDDFSDPTSGFAVGENEAGSAAYATDTYEITPSQEGAYIWTRRLLEGGPYQVLRIGGLLTPNGDGLGGLLCGGGGDNHFVGVVLATDDRWFAIEIVPGAERVTILGQGVVTDTTLSSPFVTLALTAECAITDGGLELILSEGDPALPIVAYRGEGGPASFDRVALYGESLADGFSLTIDDVTVSGGQSGGGLVNLLLEHIPAAYQPSCQETPPSAAEPGALVAVACFRQASGAGAEIVEYVQFDSAQAMDEAYAQRLEQWFTEEEADSCQEGASESSYSIGDETAGEVFCAPQTAGIRMDWTDMRLNILTSASEFEGSYADVYQTWQEAGPNL